MIVQEVINPFEGSSDLFVSNHNYHWLLLIHNYKVVTGLDVGDKHTP